MFYGYHIVLTSVIINNKMINEKHVIYILSECDSFLTLIALLYRNY